MEIKLDSAVVVAGTSISGWVSADRPTNGDWLHFELRHAESTTETPLTAEKTSVRVPGGVLIPGQPVPFTFRVPSWIAPSFVGQTVSNLWWLHVSAGADEYERSRQNVAVSVDVLPTKSGRPIPEDRVGEVEWQRIREQWVSVKGKAHDGIGYSSFVYALVLSAGVAVALSWLFGWYGALASLLYAVPMSGQSWRRYRRTRSMVKTGNIHLSGVPVVASSGDWIEVGVETETPVSVTLTLRCTEWRYISREGGGEHKPTIVYQNRAVVAAPGSVRFQIPISGLPSVRIGLTSVQWDVIAQRGSMPDDAVPSASEHLVVISTA